MMRKNRDGFQLITVRRDIRRWRATEEGYRTKDEASTEKMDSDRDRALVIYPSLFSV